MEIAVQNAGDVCVMERAGDGRKAALYFVGGNALSSRDALAQCFAWHILHDEIALVSCNIVDILHKSNIVKLDDLAIFELFDLLGAQQKGFFAFEGDKGGVKYFDDDVFLTLFA